MARLALSLVAGSTTIGNENFSSPHAEADPADQTALAAAMAVLVADAASPTQAHVTTANTALTAITPVAKDLVVSFDKAKISSISSLRAALNLVLKAAEAAGLAK
jgi:hypothetical protein